MPITPVRPITPTTQHTGLDARRYRRRTTYLQVATAAGCFISVALALLPR